MPVDDKSLISTTDDRKRERYRATYRATTAVACEKLTVSGRSPQGEFARERVTWSPAMGGATSPYSVGFSAASTVLNCPARRREG
ncbi:hypothetical protein BN2476_120040 [Paraburkholderia piptadeniae]|uniref:Uncharacterized protein n=1 Tax=Paraburkholderia piptadeniae TaxID=1701573 RepID=A0A1N7RR38_9BURK|nr:hypothetical protein BN2476_120040 [Paraburkholderia piptadeniae]